MRLRFRYVRDRSAIAHIWDYIKGRQDHALCGHGYEDPVELQTGERPRRVCRACQALMSQAEAVLWRKAAEEAIASKRKSGREYTSLSAEYEALWSEYEVYAVDYESLRTDYEDLYNQYEELRVDYDRLERKHETLRVHAENQRRMLAILQGKRAAKSPRHKSRKPISSPKTAVYARPSTEAAESGTTPKKPKKLKTSSSGKVNPGRRVPSGRPRVKLLS